MPDILIDAKEFIHLAEGIILDMRSGKEISDERIKEMKTLAFSHGGEDDEIAGKMIVVAVDIDERCRQIFDAPQNEVDDLADELNDLVYEYNQRISRR